MNRIIEVLTTQLQDLWQAPNATPTSSVYQQVIQPQITNNIEGRYRILVP